jgi:hypothetical protein
VVRLTSVAALVLALVVAGCGGGASGQAPADGGGAAPPVLEGPPLSTVIFGTAYDPSTLALDGKASSFKAGTSIVGVGRVLAARPASEVTVKLTSPGAPAVAPIPVSAGAGDPATVFAVDLTPLNLAPGTWIVNFVSPNNRVLATGNLAVTP